MICIKKSLAILISVLFFMSCNNNIHKEYYENGKLKEEYEAIDTVKNGFYKSYFENGTLKKECTYENGEYQGLVKGYYPDGKIKWEGSYNSGVKNGIFKDYFEDGTIKIEGNFKNGKQDGITKSYLPSGKLEKEQVWQEGKQNGYFKEYDEEGKLKLFAMIETDSVKYWEEYNEKGELIKLHRKINIDPKIDTISVNKEFIAKIIISGPHPENVKLTIGIWPTGVFKGRPKFEDVVIKNGVATYPIKVSKAGGYYFDVSIKDDRLPDYMESVTSEIYSKEN